MLECDATILQAHKDAMEMRDIELSKVKSVIEINNLTIHDLKENYKTHIDDRNKDIERITRET